MMNKIFSMYFFLVLYPVMSQSGLCMSGLNSTSRVAPAKPHIFNCADEGAFADWIDRFFDGRLQRNSLVGDRVLSAMPRRASQISSLQNSTSLSMNGMSAWLIRAEENSQRLLQKENMVIVNVLKKKEDRKKRKVVVKQKEQVDAILQVIVAEQEAPVQEVKAPGIHYGHYRLRRRNNPVTWKEQQDVVEQVWKEQERIVERTQATFEHQHHKRSLSSSIIRKIIAEEKTVGKKTD